MCVLYCSLGDGPGVSNVAVYRFRHDKAGSGIRKSNPATVGVGGYVCAYLIRNEDSVQFIDRGS